MRLSTFSRGVAAVAVLGLAAPAFSATLPVPLSDLLSGGSVEVGGITFDNFDYTSNATGAGNSSIPASAITVDSLEPEGAIGLKFTSLISIADGAQDITISYQAHSDTPFNAVGLTFNGEVSSDDYLAQTTETVRTIDGLTTLGQLSVFNTGDDMDLDDVLPLAGEYTDITLRKDILVSVVGANPNGFATISVVGNAFGAAPIPEPASLVLLPLAIAGLGLKRRFRR